MKCLSPPPVRASEKGIAYSVSEKSTRAADEIRRELARRMVREKLPAPSTCAELRRRANGSGE